MKLNQLDGMLAFLTVAQERSFTAAAAQLEVSPSAISQSVRLLEEKLGMRLLNRTTRSVSLTEAGERFLARVAPALAELNAATQELDSFRTTPTGLLRLNIPHVVWEMYLRELLANFLAINPGLSVELQFEDGFVDIVNDGFDAGIRLGESVQRDMIAVPLAASADVCLVASPAYIQRCGMPQSIEDLRTHSCIRYRFRASKSVYRWELIRDGELVEVEVDGPLTVNDGRSMREAALEGIGIANVFKRQVAKDMAQGILIGVLSQHWANFGRFCIYYPSRKQMPLKLRAFIDFCKQEITA
jgi:DNA-binding transcriptional LysR family regulator